MCCIVLRGKYWRRKAPEPEMQIIYSLRLLLHDATYVAQNIVKTPIESELYACEPELLNFHVQRYFFMIPI